MATERRSEKLAIYLEPTIDNAVRLGLQPSETISDYFRKLAIEDLKKRGLLTEQMLLDILI
jgi:hypothetical protein